MFTFKIDKEGEFYGTIAFQNCDVAEQLIKQGMAKFVAWNAPPQNKDLLCKLESEAKQKKLRYWKNFDESSAPSPSPSSSSSSSKTNEFIGIIPPFSLIIHIYDYYNEFQLLVIDHHMIRR